MNHFRVLSWRDILRDLCDTPQKKQKAAEISGVSVRTIDRWISGSSDPQKHESIRGLATLSDEMGGLLREQWPEAFAPQTTTRLPFERIMLPEEFRRRVLRAYAHTSRNVQRWTIYQLVSSQMIAHLDSEQAGLMIVYVRAETLLTGKLRILERAGSAVWTTRQTLSEFCSEPWIVEAVREARPFFIQSLTDASLPSPACFANKDLIQSVGFFPLYRAGCVGGGILILSTKTDFFTPVRQTLIEEYSELLALAFCDTDFQC